MQFRTVTVLMRRQVKESVDDANTAIVPVTRKPEQFVKPAEHLYVRHTAHCCAWIAIRTEDIGRTRCTLVLYDTA